MQSPRTIRSLGILMIALGLILCASMAYLVYWLRQALAHGGWHGGAEFTHITFGLFYSISVFGCVSLGSGCFQLVTGRRSRIFVALTLCALLPVAYFLSRVLAM